MTFECNQKMTFECKGLENRVNDIEASIADLTDGKLDKTAVVQETGTGTDVVMSQKAVTDALASAGKGLNTLTDVNLTLGDTTVQYDTTDGIQINSTARFIDGDGNHDATMDLDIPIVAGDNVTIDKASTGEQVVVSSKYPNVIQIGGATKLTDEQAALALANPETTIFKKYAQCYFPLNPYNHNGKLSGKYVCLQNLQVTNPPRWVISLLEFTDNAFTTVDKDVQMEAFVNLYSKSGTLTQDQYNIIKEQNAVINLGDGNNNTTTYVHAGFISGDGYIYTVAGVTGTAVPKNSAIRIHIDKTYEVIDQPDAGGGLPTIKAGTGQYSEIFNYDASNPNTANGIHSHAEGTKTQANGDHSHAEGHSSHADGDYSHAEGTNTKATNVHCHSEGYYTTADGQSSHAEGFRTSTSGLASHAEGYYTVSNNVGSHAEGKYNISPMPEDLIHATGIGDYDAKRDGFEVYTTGEVWCKGPLYVGGVDDSGADLYTLDRTKAKEVATIEYVDSKAGGVTSLDGQNGALTTKTLFGNSSILGTGNIDLYRHRITIDNAGSYKVVLTYVSSKSLNVDSMTDLKSLITEEGWFECAVVSPDPVFAFYVNPQTLAIKGYSYNSSSEILKTTGALGGTITDSITTI